MEGNDMKTNKHLTLQLANQLGVIRSQDLVEHFNYSPGTARSYLSYLAKQRLLERTGMGYVLTKKGKDRLHYFDVVGCEGFDCPLCQKKRANHFTCPRCGYQIPKDEATILPKWEFILAVRLSGVYCPICQKGIFTEEQAQLIGISKEE